MRIIEKREIPELESRLYLAELPGEGFRLSEFVDTVEPGVDKRKKWVLMISTQFGCPVGCRMCDAGAMGYHGDLTADEMLAQIRKVVEDNPRLDPLTHPKFKIHFARMGEPALNPAVLEVLRRLPSEMPFPGLMPSISTVAPASPQAERFMEELPAVKDRYYSGGRFQLQFSVHSTDPRRRRRIVPVPVWGPEEIAAYSRRFVRAGDRKITVNFALSSGERLDAAEIKRVFDPALALIKVTPVNPTWTAERSGSAFVWHRAPEELAAAGAELRAAGFEVILSPSTPEEIEAETSCGQLWAARMKKRAVAGVYEQRGRRSLPFDPGRSALLVVDMQEFFLNPASPAYMPRAVPALKNAAKLTAAFREAGRPVFFTSHTHRDPAADGGLMAKWWGKVCLEGTPWGAVHPSLGPRAGEVFTKRRYSAFTAEGLLERLRASGINSLVVAGLKTNLCVESTVRDAFDFDFVCVAAGDAMAARSEDEHLASLRAMAEGFAMVRRSADAAARVKDSPGLP